MARLVPAVKTSGHINAFRIRSPHREVRSGDAIDDAMLRAHLFVELEMAAFVEKV